MRKRKGRRIKCLRERPKKKSSQWKLFFDWNKVSSWAWLSQSKGVAHLRIQAQ